MVNVGASTSGYQWPPPRAVPVTRAPEEDLIDLSDDYECTSERVRVSGPIVNPLVPQTLASSTMQQSVIRPIPRIQIQTDLRRMPLDVNSVGAELYNHQRVLPQSVPPDVTGAAAILAPSPDGEEASAEELLQGQAIQCIHFGVV